MTKSSWYIIPAAFFLLINFVISPVKIFFFWRLIYFLFFISFFFFLKNFDLSKIIKFSIGGSSLIIFLYGIIQKFFLFPHYLKTIEPGNDFYSQALIIRLKSGRVFSIFTLPALYAIICCIFIIFILHYMIRSKRKFFWGGLMALGLFNLVLTQSFGGLLYLSVGILIYLFMSGILKLRFLAPVVMVISLFFFIVAGLRFSEVKRLEPFKLRVSNWNQALRVIQSNPLWGVGLGNYEAEISNHILSGESRSIYSHNFVLQFVAENGVLIAILIIFILFFLRKKLKPPDRKERVLYLSAFFIILIYNALDIGFYFFSSALATVVVLSQMYRVSLKTENHFNLRFKLNLVFLFSLGMVLVLGAISDGYQKKGDFQFHQKDFLESKQSYRKSLIFNPCNHKAIVARALVEFSEENFQDCYNYLKRALKLYPDSAFANHLMSKIHYHKGQFFSAFFLASNAHHKDRLNPQYAAWYKYIKDHLQEILSLTGG